MDMKNVQCLVEEVISIFVDDFKKSLFQVLPHGLSKTGAWTMLFEGQSLTESNSHARLPRGRELTEQRKKQ